jgi:putative membrane protein
MSRTIGTLHAQGSIDSFGRLSFVNNIPARGHAQAGCERIATTSLPFVYSLLIRWTTYLYCILLPFGLLETVGPFLPVFVAIVAYVFFSLQAVTNQIEHPFRRVKNGLPLDAMCRAIKVSVVEALDQKPPAPLLPKDYMLT